jgi:hypothetical protein
VDLEVALPLRGNVEPQVSMVVVEQLFCDIRVSGLVGEER